MKNANKKVIVVLATCLQEDHDITTIGVEPHEQEAIHQKFETTSRIEHAIGGLIKNYFIFNKKDFNEESKKTSDMQYDRMIVALKPKTGVVLDTEGEYTYKTLRSVVSNYLEYFEQMLKKDLIPVKKNIAVCIVPVLLNKQLYELSQKIMKDFQFRNDKTQAYYKFLAFFNANRKDFFYTVYLSQNHIL